MKRFQFALMTLFTVLILGFLLYGCATPTPEPPPEPPHPAPEPEPETVPPAPEPKGTAPLVETLWELTHQYASEQLLPPPEGSVRFQFTENEDALLEVAGPVNQILSGYRHTVKESKSEDPNYEEGSLSLGAIVRTRRSGPYIRYEDLMVSNMELVQGYYIAGERPLESRLIIFGGYGREEIILFELTAVELPSE